MIWRSWSWGILELLAEILGVLDLESRGRGVQRLSRSSKILPARDFSENQPAQVHKWRSWGNGNLWGTLLGVGGEASGVHQQPHGDGCLVREGALGLEVEVGANIHITGHAREPSFENQGWVFCLINCKLLLPIKMMTIQVNFFKGLFINHLSKKDKLF